MKSFFISAALLLGACSTQPVVVPNVKSAPALDSAGTQRLSTISAHAEAAVFANEQNPPGPPREATSGALSVVRTQSGPASDKDRAAAMAIVTQALSGKLAEAQSGWSKARDEASTLNTRIGTLEAQVLRERQQAVNDLAEAVRKAKEEAARDQRKLIAWIFFGGGALLLAAAGALLFLQAYLPFAGPRASFAAGAGGVLLIGTGVALNTLLQHEWVIWTGLGLTFVAVLVSGVLMYANHHHHSKPVSP